MPMEMPTLLATNYGQAVANAAWVHPFQERQQERRIDIQSVAKMYEAAQQAAKPQAQQQQPKEKPVSDSRRLVRVVVVDPHKDVPTDQALLYDSKEVFTDKTDQELYFDVPIAQILKEHNAKRTKLVDKSVKERTEHLEPARIRDLKMLVITLAQF